MRPAGLLEMEVPVSVTIYGSGRQPPQTTEVCPTVQAIGIGGGFRSQYEVNVESTMGDQAMSIGKTPRGGAVTRKTLFGEVVIQPDFAAVDGRIATNCQCPACGYEWNAPLAKKVARPLFGKPAPVVTAGFSCPKCKHAWEGKPRAAQRFGAKDGKSIIAKTSVAVEKPLYRVPLMSEIKKFSRNGFKVVSTFSGCGGSCTGYKMAGFDVVWANEFVPAAQDSYRANFPDTILDCRDIRKVTAMQILKATGLKKGELDLFDGSPPCFPAGALVLAKRGLIPIEEIVVGDEVLTHKNRWRSVLRVGSKEAETIVLKGHGHWGLETTKEHPFWSRRLNQRYVRCGGGKSRYVKTWNDPEWIEAQDMKKLFWATPNMVEDTPLSIPAVAGRKVNFNQRFWWMVGRWLGDGWIINPRRNNFGICCSQEETSFLESMLKSVAPIAGSGNAGDGELRWTVIKVRTGTQFSCAHKGLVEWLQDNFGCGAADKTIPAWALTMKDSWRRSLLEGYFSADGFKMKEEGHSAINTVSKKLAVGTRLLVESLGMTATLVWQDMPKKTMIEGREVNQKPFFRVAWRYGETRCVQRDTEYTWGRVRRVLDGKESVIVYNIEVEEDHSFTVDGMVVKNCQSFSTAGRREKGWGKEKKYEHGAKQMNEDLFFEYVRLLKGLQPKTFVAENVSGLVKGTAKGYFKLILAALEGCGYEVAVKVLDAQWLGVPQMRQRAIFVGVRNDLAALGFHPAHPEPLPYRYTVREALPWVVKPVHGGFSVTSCEDTPSPTVTSTQCRMTTEVPVIKTRVVHDTSGKGGAAGVNSYSAGDITDKPCPAVTVGVNSLNSSHFQVLEVRGGASRWRSVVYEHEIRAGELRVSVMSTGSIRHQEAGRMRRLDAGEEPRPAIMTSPPAYSLEVEPEAALRGAVGEEWDRLADGEQSGKYFSLVKPPLDEPSPAVTAVGGTSCASVTHPVERRKFTIAELRRVCGMPDDLILTGSYSQMWARLGNAVPAVMAAAIAKTVRDKILIPARDLEKKRKK
jgi:DNA (cytosine-5)-methyltransferase 1